MSFSPLQHIFYFLETYSLKQKNIKMFQNSKYVVSYVRFLNLAFKIKKQNVFIPLVYTYATNERDWWP